MTQQLEMNKIPGEKDGGGCGRRGGERADDKVDAGGSKGIWRPWRKKNV